jgi:hypothetical protein
MTRITLALILAAFPAFAETEGWNGDDPVDPPTEEPGPETPVTVTTPNGGSAYDPYARTYFSTCTCDRVTVAWGFETPEFRKQAAVHQCSLRRERIGCELTDQEYGAGVLK